MELEALPAASVGPAHIHPDAQCSPLQSGFTALFIVMCVCVWCACVLAPEWRSEGNFRELDLSFHCGF